MLQRREEEMNKGASWMRWGRERNMARFKGWVALHPLTGWVRKDGRDSSSDSKWLTTQAIRQKYNARVLGYMCFEEYLYVRELKGALGFLHERKKEIEEGDFVAGCAVSVPWLENIVSSSFCSLERIPTVQTLASSLSPSSSSILVHLSPISVSPQPYHCLFKWQHLPLNQLHCS